MTTTEREALKAELIAELRAEMERKARDKTTYQSAMATLKPQYSALGISGKSESIFRDSIGGLLRIVYDVKYCAHLPSEYAEDIGNFVEEILELVKRYRTMHEEAHL